jgi:hypothetical protein
MNRLLKEAFEIRLHQHIKDALQVDHVIQFLIFFDYLDTIQSPVKRHSSCSAVYRLFKHVKA